jgi:triacylglycerol lipase
MGHSSGASHVAAYGFERRHQPKDGTSLVGLVLVSGLYDPVLEYLARDAFFGGQRRPANDAYYGVNEARYAEQATLRHLDGPQLPTLIVTAKLDPIPMQAKGAILFAALSERDRACPQYIVLRDHSHMSEIYSINTPDEALSN